MSEASQAEATFRLVVLSQYDQLAAVKQATRRAVEYAGLGAREAFDVLLAVHEAVVNAMTHGNGSDPSRRVDVAYWCGDDALTVCVRDEGAGFDVAAELSRAHRPPSLDRLSGRGLLLITRLMDEVQYNDIGNEVRLVKYRR
jgi:serine/threonine-protein kinase RsbW